MKQQGHLKISVTTVQNGYMLDIVSCDIQRGYMYFSKEELVEGFMYHVGLSEASPANKDYMARLLEASSRWNENRELTKRILQLDGEIQLEKSIVQTLRRSVDEKNMRITDLANDNKRLREQLREYIQKEKSGRKRGRKSFEKEDA